MHGLKAAVMAYHANAVARYDLRWIRSCVDSMNRQTCKDFDVYELNYGGGADRFFDGEFESVALPTFVHAMNYLLDALFADGYYDVVFNVNIDDKYAAERVAWQLQAINDGADVVSTNFHGINAESEIIASSRFSDLDLVTEIHAGHNIIGHGAVAYTREFWRNCSRYDPGEIPMEDLRLWQREIDKFRFVIVPGFGFYYRAHSKGVCQAGTG